MPAYLIFFIIELILHAGKRLPPRHAVSCGKGRDPLFRRAQHNDHLVELPLIAALKEKGHFRKYNIPLCGAHVIP